MDEQRIALVTGGNRGIGFEICRQLAKPGVLVIPGSRDAAKRSWCRRRTDCRAPSRQKGAETAVWLATLPDNGPTGLFFRDRKTIPW